MYKWITIVKYVINISITRANICISYQNLIKKFDKSEHIVLSLKDIDKNNVNEAFYLYVIEYIKKTDYYLVKCQLKLVFDEYQDTP